MGSVVKNRTAVEDPFMDLFGRMLSHYWTLLEPAIVLMRGRRGQAQYHNFESVAIHANAWIAKHPAGIFPRGTARKPLPDPWLASDEATGAPSPDGHAAVANATLRIGNL